ncbi:autotransporter outer membrane beta-barrel domain-containing protein [Bradyrhizobium shewense]|uniref:autotransporter outer membrane beta-barrel domain-containing protein n=1 Tax=Bradyrhizobium shewense TaxID=1761772 RepID=UPI001FDA2AFD|nr:autotransporter outer membrane beta-barrel domain-containing protein [Bradyrhizobium shewense]
MPLTFAAAIVLEDAARADGGAGSQGSPSGGVGGLDNPTGAGGTGGNATNNSGGGGGGAGVTGGLGGAGNTNGGNGGQGGAHGYFDVGAGLPASASTGSNGADGFDGAPGGGGGGGGGAGGYGAVITTSGVLGTLNVNVIGGAGGNGGMGTNVFRGGEAGTGGIGLDVTSGASTTLAIGSGITVQGGDGGIGGVGGSFGSGNGGAGGAGITGAGLTIINAGTIRKGAGGAGGLSGGGAAGLVGADGNAITFTGGTNILEIRFGSSITGKVVAFSSADTFRLGGSTNASFDVSGLGAQYQGFGIFAKTGTSTWTLTGTPGTATPWTISAGTLAAGAGTNVFGSTSAITVNSPGTLDLAGFNQTIGSLTGNTGATVTNSAAAAATLTTNGAGNASTSYAGNITDTAVTGGAAAAGALHLVKNGTGTLTLSGATGSLTYHGDTTVNVGTLHITNSTFTNQQGSNLTVNNAGTYQIDHLLTNSGVILVNVGGVLNAIAGGITNNATGTITNNGQINDALNNAGTVTNNLSYNADVATNTGTITNASTGTWTGNVISNAGNATGIANNGIWIGNVVSSTGTINNSLTWTGTISNNAGGTFNNNAPGTVSGLVTNAGTGTNSGALNGGLLNTVGTFANTGTIGGVAVSGGTVTNSNIVSAGVSVSGAGIYTQTKGTTSGGLASTATVNANGGAINGGIAVNNGTFNVGGNVTTDNSFVTGGVAQLNVTGGNFTGITTLTNNSNNANGIVVAATRTLSATSLVNAAGATISNLGTITTNSTVNDGTITGAYAMAGGTLSGVGNTANLAVNGGIFAPGNGAAGSSMTVTGSLVLQAAATYLVQIDPGAASFANITGTATLNGATVNAVFANGSYVAKQYTILTAGHVNGPFSGPVNTNLPDGFKTALSYDATHAYLDLSLVFASNFGGLNGNQQAVGNTLINFFNSTGRIPLVFGALTPAGLTQISGETATGSQQTTFNAMNQFMGVMTDPFVAGRGEPISGGGSPNAYAEESLPDAARGATRSKGARDAYAAIYAKAPPIATVFEQRWSVWAVGFGGSQTTAGDTIAGSNSTRSNLAAGAVGADYRISANTLAGFALAGGGTSFSVNGSGSGRSDLFQAGAFVRHNAGPAYITGALAYGWQDITTDRTVTVAGVDRLRAQFRANAWSGRLEGGYRFVSQGFGWTPYAAGQFIAFELPAYAEQAIVGSNVFALAYNAKSVTDSRGEVGLRTDKSFGVQSGIFTLRGRAAWAHDFNPDRSIGATFQTLPGASFIVNGARQAGDAALVTGSAGMTWLNGWSAAATFEGEFSNVTRSYAGKGVVRYAW